MVAFSIQFMSDWEWGYHMGMHTSYFVFPKKNPYMHWHLNLYYLHPLVKCVSGNYRYIKQHCVFCIISGPDLKMAVLASKIAFFKCNFCPTISWNRTYITSSVAHITYSMLHVTLWSIRSIHGEGDMQQSKIQRHNNLHFMGFLLSTFYWLLS